MIGEPAAGTEGEDDLDVPAAALLAAASALRLKMSPEQARAWWRGDLDGLRMRQDLLRRRAALQRAADEVRRRL